MAIIYLVLVTDSKTDKFNNRGRMFECKLEPHIFRVLVTKLVNERARLATKAN